MNYRPKSLILSLASIFTGAALNLNRYYYIVSTKRERHAKYPRMERTPSRTKSRKRHRSIVRIRSHRS